MINLHSQEMPETTDKDKTWEWIREGSLKVETEALICAAQEQALRTNYIKSCQYRQVRSLPAV